MLCGAKDCETAFEPRTSWQKFCSLRCKDRARSGTPKRLANHRASYRRNPERVKKHALLNLEKKKERVRELKSGPCADCDVSYPYYVMDFDHVRGEKYGAVGTMLATGYAMATVEAEIAKCDLVCANCHRVRTFTREAQD